MVSVLCCGMTSAAGTGGSFVFPSLALSLTLRRVVNGTFVGIAVNLSFAFYFLDKVSTFIVSRSCLEHHF